MSKRVLIAAGGTGGHVFPALAIAHKISAMGGEVCWLGAGGMEMQTVPAHGFALHAVPFKPPRGVGGAARLVVAAWRAWQLLHKLRPAAVLGMGGYAAAPGGVAAKLSGIPLLVHEQNAVAGRANRMLHKIAQKVLTGFPNALASGDWVGNPVREEFCRQRPPQERALSVPPRRLLILGGSQGAQILNTQIPAALARLPEQFSIVHQCGRGHAKATVAAYQQASRPAAVHEFMEDVAAPMAAADLVICRAGAATLAELAAVGAAALLVPYPFAAANHQSHNAKFFIERGAAVGCEQEQLSGEWLAGFLGGLSMPMLLDMAQAARKLAKPEAAAAVAAACLAEAGHAA